MVLQEIVLDTETTGLNPNGKDRIVEIGCVELENYLPTGRTYHQYINPKRDMPEEAFKVHGLSEAFLSEKPVFEDIAKEFIDFIGDRALVIHNAEFDIAFINAEFKKIGQLIIPLSRSVDTLKLARKQFPGSPANLDALCRRFGIDHIDRTYHGALRDAQILAEVYLELIGGRQQALELKELKSSSRIKSGPVRAPLAARPHCATEVELTDHQKFVDGISNAIWRR